MIFLQGWWWEPHINNSGFQTALEVPRSAKRAETECSDTDVDKADCVVTASVSAMPNREEGGLR